MSNDLLFVLPTNNNSILYSIHAGATTSSNMQAHSQLWGAKRIKILLERVDSLIAK